MKLYFYKLIEGEDFDNMTDIFLVSEIYRDDEEFKKQILHNIQWLQSEMNPDPNKEVSLKTLVKSLEDNSYYPVNLHGVADMFTIENVKGLEDINGDLEYHNFEVSKWR